MPRRPTGGKTGRPTKAERPILTEAQSASIDREVAILLQDGKFPKAAHLARELGVTRAAVSKWRKDDVYLAHRSRHYDKELQKVVELLAAEVSSRLDNKRSHEALEREEAFARVQNNPRPYITAFVRREWRGPMTLPGGERFFQKPEEWIDYLLEKNLLSFDDVEAVLRRLKNGIQSNQDEP